MEASVGPFNQAFAYSVFVTLYRHVDANHGGRRPLRKSPFKVSVRQQLWECELAPRAQHLACAEAAVTMQPCWCLVTITLTVYTIGLMADQGSPLGRCCRAPARVCSSAIRCAALGTLQVQPLFMCSLTPREAVQSCHAMALRIQICCFL